MCSFILICVTIQDTEVGIPYLEMTWSWDILIL